MSSALLSQAYTFHYAKRFQEAADAYRFLLASGPETGEVAIARQQLDNLREFDSHATEPRSGSEQITPESARPGLGRLVTIVPTRIGTLPFQGD